jgi:hypothetical protein
MSRRCQTRPGNAAQWVEVDPSGVLVEEIEKQCSEKESGCSIRQGLESIYADGAVARNGPNCVGLCHPNFLVTGSTKRVVLDELPGLLQRQFHI